MIRIAIADDHAMMRAGLAQIIELTDDMTVVGEAKNASEVLHLVRTLAFDLLLLDLSMPGASGLDLVERICREKPALPVLVLSMHDAGALVARALRLGAAGYVAKHSGPAVLLPALRKLAAGERFIDPAVVNEVVFESMAAAEQPQRILSNREYQVLKMLAEGKSVTEMARLLRLSVKTVSTHKSNIKEKLGFQADADLFRYAIENRI